MQALSLNAWFQTLALLLTSCVTLDKFLALSVPPFSFLASGTLGYFWRVRVDCRGLVLVDLLPLLRGEESEEAFGGPPGPHLRSLNSGRNILGGRCG